MSYGGLKKGVLKGFFICFWVVIALVSARPCRAAWENPIRFSDEGDFWIAWAQSADNADAEVFCAYFDGRNWSAREQVSFRPGTDMSPAVTLDSAGTPLLLWSGAAKEGGTAIFSSLRAEDGKWSEPAQVDGADAEYDTTPAVFCMADGSFGAVWAGVENGDDEICFAASQDGLSWTQTVIISEDDVYPDITPVAGLSPTGEAVAVWSAFDGVRYSLAYSVLDAESGQWSREAALTPAESVLSQEMPFITRSAGGNLRVFWKEGAAAFCAVWKDGKWTGPEAVDFTGDFRNLLSARRFPYDCGERAWIAWDRGDTAEHSVRINCIFENLGAMSYSKPRSRRAPMAAAGLDSLLDMLGACIAAPVYADVVDASKIIGFGDSITEGWGGQEYESRLASILGRAVVNAGVGGERTSSGMGRISGVLEEHQAGSILILEGTNDCGDGRSPDTIAYNLGVMVDRARAAGTTPYVATIMPRNDIFNDRVKDANVKVREMISSKSVRMADQYAAFEGRDLNSIYADQRLHPNAAGFDIMASVWAALFNSSSSGGGGGCGRVDFSGSNGTRSLNFFWLILVGLWLVIGAARRKGV